MPRKQKRYHYIYKTTCIPTGKYYIGMHSTNKLDDGYIGSGKHLWYSINKYGAEKHSKEILEWYNSRSELKKREEKMVTEDLLNEALCMNLQIGGGGGFTREQQKLNQLKSVERQKFLRENDPEWALRESKRMTDQNNKYFASGKWKKGPFYDWSGKTHKESTKKKIGAKSALHQRGSGNSQFGTCWVYSKQSGKSLKIKKKELNDYLNTGWTKGRIIK